MIEIIPAIDIIEGRCVRLSQGDYSSKKSYSGDPLEMALRFEDAGLKRLHLVDLDGARQGRIVSYKILEKIAHRSGLIIDFGGGIRTDKDLEIAFECGAKMITAGSIAVKDRERTLSWLKRFGAGALILGADVKQDKIAVNGWQEGSDLNIYDFLKEYLEAGFEQVICTDISKDGMLEGPSLDLYKKIRDEVGEVSLIASGGVSSLKDIEALQKINLDGVIVGKAFYEGRIQLSELKRVYAL